MQNKLTNRAAASERGGVVCFILELRKKPHEEILRHFFEGGFRMGKKAKAMEVVKTTNWLEELSSKGIITQGDLNNYKPLVSSPLHWTVVDGDTVKGVSPKILKLKEFIKALFIQYPTLILTESEVRKFSFQYYANTEKNIILEKIKNYNEFAERRGTEKIQFNNELDFSNSVIPAEFEFSVREVYEAVVYLNEFGRNSITDLFEPLYLSMRVSNGFYTVKTVQDKVKYPLTLSKISSSALEEEKEKRARANLARAQERLHVLQSYNLSTVAEADRKIRELNKSVATVTDEVTGLREKAVIIFKNRK